MDQKKDMQNTLVMISFLAEWRKMNMSNKGYIPKDAAQTFLVKGGTQTDISSEKRFIQ